MCLRGQLSAEMMILIVVVLAIVAIAATQLMNAAQDSAGQIENQTGQLYDKTSDAMKAGPGEVCFDDDDCRSGDCDLTVNKCD